MKAELPGSTAGQSIPSPSNPKESNSEPAVMAEGGAAAAPSPTIDVNPAAAEQASSTTLPISPAQSKATTSASSSREKSASAPKQSAEKAANLSKTAANSNALASAPTEPQPALPVSMIVRPDSAGNPSSPLRFSDELDESYESALARVQWKHAHKSLAARILMSIRTLILSEVGRSTDSAYMDRTVAFDGFREDMFESKRERDRRYGTVYSVSDEVNSFIVRLELPRRMPQSSLKQTWEVSDEMPDYAFALNLTDNVLCIRAGLPDEARRRLSYVSSSFPSDFQTRIEFPAPVEGYTHRLADKVLEIIVFKRERVDNEKNHVSRL